MKPMLLALALSTCCLTLSGCETFRIKEPIEIPADRMDCTELDGRPQIPDEYVIDWSGVVTVDQARGEHQAFVKRLREREKIIGGRDGYIVRLEERLFACADDAEWLRDFMSGIPAED